MIELLYLKNAFNEESLFNLRKNKQNVSFTCTYSMIISWNFRSLSLFCAIILSVSRYPWI